MLNAIIFTTEEELSELTGLDHDGLWDVGFDLDDWDIGFCFDEKIHQEIHHSDTEDFEISDIDGFEINDEEDEDYHREICCTDLDSDYWWLMDKMCTYCVGPTYCEYKGKHYYLVHHA